MAYVPYEKLPKGGIKSYKDTVSGEVIPASRYRNIRAVAQGKPTLYQKEVQRAQSKGFRTPKEKYKAQKPETKLNPKVSTEHKRYSLGKPQDLSLVLTNAINENKSYGFGMYITVHVRITPERGKPYNQYVSSTVHRINEKEIDDMIEEALNGIVGYGESYEILEWFIIFLTKVDKE